MRFIFLHFFFSIETDISAAPPKPTRPPLRMLRPCHRSRWLIWYVSMSCSAFTGFRSDTVSWSLERNLANTSMLSLFGLCGFLFTFSDLFQSEAERSRQDCIEKLLRILSGDETIHLHMQFLIKNNHTDMLLLKQIKVRLSTCSPYIHSYGTVVSRERIVLLILREVADARLRRSTTISGVGCVRLCFVCNPRAIPCLSYVPEIPRDGEVHMNCQYCLICVSSMLNCSFSN